MRKLLDTTEKNEAQELLPKTISLVDRMAKQNIIHKNKAGHLKSRLTRYVSGL